MPRIPDARDVPRVRAQPDPGVRAPAEAFGGQIGEAFVGVGADLHRTGQIIDKKQKRREAINNAREENSLIEDVAAEIERLSTEEDLSDSTVMDRFGEWLADRQQAALDRAGGRPEARANLAVAVEDIGGRFRSKFGAMSALAGTRAVEQAMGERLNTLVREAARDPESVNDLFRLAGESVNTFASALRPEQEAAAIAAARDQIAEAAITSVMAGGDFDLAEEMLVSVGDAMTPGAEQAVRMRIQKERHDQNAQERELAFIERELERPLSETEFLTWVRARPSTSGGMTVFGPDGRPIVTTGSVPPGSLTTANQTALQERALQTQDRLARLSGIGEAFQPELLTLPEQGKIAFSKIKERLGVDISDEERKRIEDAATLSRRALEDLNLTLRDMSGAAITPQEADRLRAAMPDPENDSPTEFVAKYNDLVSTLQGAQTRYLQQLGVQPAAAGSDDGMQIIQDQAAYDALPVGTQYRTVEGGEVFTKR